MGVQRYAAMGDVWGGWVAGWQGRHACWPYQLGLQVILLLMALSSPPDTDEAP